MKPSVRAWPFESKYLRDFAVVEERRHGLRLFPATEQLPLLSSAINREFESGLTSRLASTDARGDMWRKLCLWKSANSFCQYLNSARPDHLHVQPYYTPELVTQVAVVQQVTRITRNGNQHWFRFFHGDAFLPDIYLAGKRVIFTTHAIDRFAERADDSNLHAVNRLLTDFFYAVPLILQLDGHSYAFAFPAGGTLAAMPFVFEGEELVCLTTLSPNEISSLAAPDPLVRSHFHYGPQRPTRLSRTNFKLDAHAEKVLKLWRDKIPCADMRETYDKLQHFTWTFHVQLTPKTLRNQGMTKDSSLEFYDDVYGPTVLTRTPKPPAPVS